VRSASTDVTGRYALPTCDRALSTGSLRHGFKTYVQRASSWKWPATEASHYSANRLGDRERGRSSSTRPGGNKDNLVAQVVTSKGWVDLPLNAQSRDLLKITGFSTPS